ncbi:MAG TPA: TCR/Tet family MFS transporter [Pseudobdellovibrionaceae bacterium]|nr:TCR/Tet family MFS transporter [Pseudobdellovibrionaceae bacterium]
MRPTRAGAQFIFITMFLDALGIGILIPVFPDVIRRFGTDPGFVSHMFGYFIAVYALMQFLASPVLGSLSDRYGRRPVLLLSLLCAGIDYLVMAFAPTLWILFLGRVVSGLTGASMTVASSYMADISDDSNRSANFGLIGAAFGLGFIVGPALGGLLGGWGPTAPFLLAAAMNLLNFAFGLIVLPESLPEQSRRNVDLKRLNPFKSVIKVLSPSPIMILVWVYFFVYLAGHVHPSIWTLYTQEKFGWSVFEVGLSLSAVGILSAISQGYLTRILIPRWGEVKALEFGLIVYAVSFVLYAVATQGWMIYPILIATFVAGIAGPALQSLISKDVPSQEQGELQGSLISLASLTAIAAPLLYTDLFARFSGPQAGIRFPGMPYIAAALICAISFVLFLFSPLRKGPR